MKTKQVAICVAVMLIIVLSAFAYFMVQQNALAKIEESRTYYYDAKFRVSHWMYAPLGSDDISPTEIPIELETFVIEMFDSNGYRVDIMTTSNGLVESALHLYMDKLCEYTVIIKGTFDFEVVSPDVNDFRYDGTIDVWYQWIATYQLTLTSGVPNPDTYWQLDIELGPKLV